MLHFILKRVGYMFVTLFFVITITFVLIHSIPGDPLAFMAKNLPEQTRDNFYKKYGLDKPKTTQYAVFMKNLLKGDLGESLRYPGRSVSTTIKETAPVSGAIGGPALLIGTILGIFLGILAGLYRNMWPDYIVMFVAILGVTIPVFVLASLAQYFFTVKWDIFPTTGWPTGPGKWRYAILPMLVLSVGTVATYARYMKSSVQDVINQDYILTAEAKGVTPFNVVRKHIVRNAILPAITILGPRVAAIFTGSFVIERMFGIPGLGYYYVSSITDRDYTMILGTTVFYAILFVVVQLIVDVLYSVIDPRISFS